MPNCHCQQSNACGLAGDRLELTVDIYASIDCTLFLSNNLIQLFVFNTVFL